MSLLVFSYILAIVLFIFSYYLDSRSDKTNSIFTGMTMTSAFIALFAALAANLLYAGAASVGTFVFRLCLVCVAFVTISVFRFAFAVPYFARNVFMNVLSWLLMLFAVYVSFTGIAHLGWSESGGFIIDENSLFGSFDGMYFFTAVYLIALPSLAVLALVLRAFGIRSRIYRQRLLFVAVSVIAGFTVSVMLYELSLQYFWAFPLVPFGFAVMLILVYQSISITTLFDRSLVLATAINFTVLSLVFSSVAALISTLLIQTIAVQSVAVVSLIVATVVLLSLRTVVTHRLHKYVRIGSEYETELEAGLDSLDYTSGGEEVIRKTVSLLDQYVECTSVDILVSDDKGKVATIFSTMNAKNELNMENKAVDFLVNHNESIVLKTQAIANHIYADVKTDLLKLFDIGHSDALMLLREGHRVVGIILLGAKKRGADYTDYDYSVLSKLYSNFFLVMYYLKNIANESVILTVDREIEFSAQIITSIQDNIDRITHDKVDVDFITRSARKLGGDFIDFIKLAEDKYLYVMGDVSGKGLNASMSMVILKSVLRTFLTETGDFKKLVVKVNLFIKNNLPKGTFFAGVFGLMDFSTNTMYYINCGVPAMFLYTAAYNNAIEIQGDGRVLGFVRDIGKYLKVKKIVLNPLDTILMTTDGLVDSTNLRGERFGKDRVQRQLMDNRSYPAGRMAQFLCDSLTEFVSRELEDDITVLVFKYLNR